MRGDSLRDLYAKALALIGLGVLAGVGALVDYWPVAGPLPAIAGAPLAPAIPRSISPSAVGQVPIQTRAIAPQLAVRLPKAAAVNPQPIPLVAPAVAGTLEPSQTSALAGTSDEVELGPFRAHLGSDADDSVMALAPAPGDSSATVALPATPPTTDPADLFGETPVARVVLAEVTDEAGEGLITGAFKRTGTSIVKTGARTGASIFDAVRIVSGMVRRALPTN